MKKTICVRCKKEIKSEDERVYDEEMGFYLNVHKACENLFSDEIDPETLEVRMSHPDFHQTWD